MTGHTSLTEQTNKQASILYPIGKMIQPFGFIGFIGFIDESHLGTFWLKIKIKFSKTTIGVDLNSTKFSICSIEIYFNGKKQTEQLDGEIFPK